MSPSVIGLFTGLLLGLAWVVGGFDAFLGTALLGAVGFIVGKVIAGQLDLTTYLVGGGRNSRLAPPAPWLPGRRPAAPGSPRTSAARCPSWGTLPTAAA